MGNGEVAARVRVHARGILSGPKGTGMPGRDAFSDTIRGAIRTVRACVHAPARVCYQKRSNINDLL